MMICCGVEQIEGYIPMIVVTTVFVMMIGIVFVTFKLLIKIKADEDLFASMLFLKKTASTTSHYSPYSAQ